LCLVRKISLGEYRNLMHAFSTGIMSASEFEAGYSRLADEDNATRGEEISLILDGVSADIAASSSDAPSNKERVDERGLRARVTEALRVLDAMRHGGV
jgi:Bacterial self-protective colicin-like immunity